MVLSEHTKSVLACDDASSHYQCAEPFSHCVIDNFFEESIASSIANEFPAYDSQFLDSYSNEIEDKKLVNHWNRFGPSTYQAFSYLCSSDFTNKLRCFTKSSETLVADSGLHGGGIHMHKNGGKLNVHMDYSVHPKLKLQRKLNILVYMTPEWDQSWGGFLGLYDNKSKEKPGLLVEAIIPIFNRAVIFDVTMNSWHGLPVPIDCPEDTSRNSLAVYYLQNPDQSADPERKKALFAPSPWQEHDQSVLDLIRKRSQIDSASSVYLG